MSDKVITFDTEQHVPEEVKKAFKMVQRLYPGVTQVRYDEDCRWQYSDGKDYSPDFSTEPYNIDTAVLEDAADAVYSIGVPVTYKL